jgi:methionyl-tRNA formyltransferase
MMTSISLPAKNQSKIRVAVVAKFSWYLDDAKRCFSDTEYQVLTFSTLDELKNEISINSNLDFIFFPHFSEIIPPSIYENFLCIGFHTGDLPADRGGSPIQNKILSGKYLTNVSAFKITKGIDAGPVFKQHVIDLSEGTIVEILQNLSKICATMMIDIVRNSPVPIEQIGQIQVKVRRKPIDSLLPQSKVGIRALYDHIRMVDGLDYPSAYIAWGDLIIEFTSAKLEGGKLTATCAIREGN